MAGYNLTTRSGRDFYEMASLLQKSIRRGKYEDAGYAAHELSQRYRKYLWKRLLVISAEDCYGIITKEIVGLKLADDETGSKEDIFIAKAIVLLCQQRKNRDACYFACNFMTDSLMNPEDIEVPTELERCKLEKDIIPDYVFDVHTLKGKMRGKTILDMIKEEQEALYPKQMSLFDEADWGNYLRSQKR